MKKLNNKGTTIIELIISVALLSVVLIFMYQLLNNVKFEKNNEEFASKNQEQRIEIIDYIEDTLEGVNTFTTFRKFKQRVYTASNNKINVKDVSETVKSWVLDSNYSMGGSFTIKKCIQLYDDASDETNDIYLCEATLEIYTENSNNNEVNNNILDDITFSFYNNQDIS